MIEASKTLLLSQARCPAADGRVIARFSLGSDRRLDQDGASAGIIPYNALAFQPCAEELSEFTVFSHPLNAMLV